MLPVRLHRVVSRLCVSSAEGHAQVARTKRLCQRAGDAIAFRKSNEDMQRVLCYNIYQANHVSLSQIKGCR